MSILAFFGIAVELRIILLDKSVHIYQSVPISIGRRMRKDEEGGEEEKLIFKIGLHIEKALTLSHARLVISHFLRYHTASQ